MKGEDGMLQIGLTGGIASGKSTVVAMLRQLEQGLSTVISLPMMSCVPALLG